MAATVDPTEELTSTEAAEMLEISQPGVRKAIARKKLGARKKGRDWMIPRKEIDRYREEVQEPWQNTHPTSTAKTRGHSSA